MNHIMTSLGVISLFTNVPLNLVMTSIERRWHYISPNTKLFLDQFILGIKMLMEQNFFKLDHQFYRQPFGTPMGSPISPTLSDFVMQDLKTDIFKKIDFNIPIYFQYVDDTFLFIPENNVHDILTIFNSYHKRLRFTYEIENNNFLNVLVIKNNDGSIPTNWFRKKSFSGRFLSYFHHFLYIKKLVLLKTLLI